MVCLLTVVRGSLLHHGILPSLDAEVDSEYSYLEESNVTGFDPNSDDYSHLENGVLRMPHSRLSSEDRYARPQRKAWVRGCMSLSLAWV